jgi:hypothetical protein
MAALAVAAGSAVSPAYRIQVNEALCPCLLLQLLVLIQLLFYVD